jgi:peptidoglycan/LPS O-acetylase OafA/YrhL
LQIGRAVGIVQVAALAATIGLATIRATGMAVFAVAILLVVLARPAPESLFSHPLARWLGDISYSVYLLHVPALIVAMMLAKRLGVLETGGPVVFGACYIGALLAAAHLSWRFVERPARSYFRRQFRGLPQSSG